MTEIKRSRVIRPSSRQEISKSYKIDTKKVSANDILIVQITHESLPFSREYRFNGAQVANKNSIHFKVSQNDDKVHIIWMAIEPV